jgi:YHS domain-containing protein
MKKVLVAMFSVALMSAIALAADAVKLEGVNCVVAANKAAKEGNSVEYKGGKVFFCCMNCPKAFAKDTAKFATAANKQLFLTGQAKQIACPYSGQDVAAGTQIKVGGAEVGFCCDKCKGKTEKASAEEAVEMVFNDKAFDKGFKVGAAK